MKPYSFIRREPGHYDILERGVGKVGEIRKKVERYNLKGLKKIDYWAAYPYEDGALQAPISSRRGPGEGQMKPVMFRTRDLAALALLGNPDKKEA